MRSGVLSRAGSGQLEGLQEFYEAFLRWRELDIYLYDEDEVMCGEAGAGLETGRLMSPGKSQTLGIKITIVALTEQPHMLSSMLSPFIFNSQKNHGVGTIVIIISFYR